MLLRFSVDRNFFVTAASLRLSIDPDRPIRIMNHRLAGPITPLRRTPLSAIFWTALGGYS
jgi:hypothetical protein